MNFRGVATLTRGNKTRISTEDEIAHGMAYFPITGNVTLGSAQSGYICLVTSGSGVTVTLPAVASSAGLNYLIGNMVDQNLTINGPAANTVVTVNDLDSDGVAYSTSSQKIGALAFAFCNGSYWFIVNLSVACAMTVTT